MVSAYKDVQGMEYRHIWMLSQTLQFCSRIHCSGDFGSFVLLLVTLSNVKNSIKICCQPRRGASFKMYSNPSFWWNALYIYMYMYLSFS